MSAASGSLDMPTLPALVPPVPVHAEHQKETGQQQ